MVHRALLALHEVLAKYNAVIRVNFPPSHPVTCVMERNTSGWANGAPFTIQAFKHAAEDALYSEHAQEYSLGDGVNDILVEVRERAGHVPIDELGRKVWRKRVSIVECGLLDLVGVRANAFFGAV